MAFKFLFLFLFFLLCGRTSFQKYVRCSVPTATFLQTKFNKIFVVEGINLSTRHFEAHILLLSLSDGLDYWLYLMRDSRIEHVGRREGRRLPTASRVGPPRRARTPLHALLSGAFPSPRTCGLVYLTAIRTPSLESGVRVARCTGEPAWPRGPENSWRAYLVESPSDAVTLVHCTVSQWLVHS